MKKVKTVLAKKENNLRVVIRQSQKVITTKKELSTDKLTSDQKVDLKIWDFNTTNKFNQKQSLLAIVNGTYALVEREKNRKNEGLRPFNPIQISKPLEIILTWNNSRKIILTTEEQGTVKAYNYKQGSKQDLNKAKGRFFYEIKDLLTGYDVKDIFEDFTV